MAARTLHDDMAQNYDSGQLALCSSIHQRLLSLIDAMRSRAENPKASGPVFLFRDGPLTTSVEHGGVMVLEDFDLPSQVLHSSLLSHGGRRPPSAHSRLHAAMCGMVVTVTRRASLLRR